MFKPRKYKTVIGLTTFNRLELTKKCISNLLLNTSEPFELAIADNCSTDGTREYLKDLYSQNLIQNLILFDKNYGVAPASNSIWEKYSNHYYIKLDNDILIKNPQWLTEMLDIIEDNNNTFFVAYSFLKQLKNISYPVLQLNSRHFVQLPEANLGGACICIPPEIHSTLGYWSEDYAPYGEEDTDYSYRARLSNLKFFYMHESDYMEHLYLPTNQAHNAQNYREFKNSHRSKNTSHRGAFNLNLKLYNTGLRPLYMIRKFKTVQLSHHDFKLELNKDYSADYSKNLKKLTILENKI
jgi:GT2 family glycosyltransferase